MSPATNGKSSSPSTGDKRTAPASPQSPTKRPKKISSENGEEVKEDGSPPSEQPETIPDGWGEMNLYKSFLLSNERFELHHTIFVNSQEPEEEETKEEDELPPKIIDETDKSLWVAEVIEVRAQNPWNVWVRIKWFYRPEELPGGRQLHHGRREIIKSCVEDVISAHTVAGHADVTHWEEMDDTMDADGIDGLFWRQTFDPAKNSLSELRLHCVCRKPYNPDTTMYWCEKCQIWEHEKCLTEAIRKQYLKENPPAAGGKKPRKAKGKNIDITVIAKDESGGVTAHIGKRQKNRRGPRDPALQGDEDAKVKTESSQEQSTVSTVVPVRCLKCRNVLT